MFEQALNSKARRTALYSIIFLFGIAFASYLEISRTDMVILFFASATFLICVFFIKNKRTQFVFIVFLMLSFGFLRIAFAEPSNIREIQKLYGTTKTFEGRVSREVEQRAKSQKVVVKIDDNIEVLVWAEKYPKIEYGDIIRVSCELKKIESIEDFKYDKYLASQNIFIQCGYTQDSYVINKENKSIKKTIYALKQKFTYSIASVFPEPHASFLSGILYGEKSSLDEKYIKQFQITGSSHVLAISGYNITIIVVAFFSMLTSFYISRKKAVWIVFAGVALFVIFVGAGASVVRAAIMGITPMFARLLGRLTNPIYVLLYAALIMIIYNPLILLYDSGFQLSFAATFGLIVITPKISNRAVWFPSSVFGIRETASATLGAIIYTLPLTMYQFGNVSLVALPVNMFIMISIPIAMSTGFIASLFALISKVIGIFFATLPYVIMSYILAVIDFASRIPYASIQIKFGIIEVLISYIILLLISFPFWLKYMKRESKKNIEIEIDNKIWKIKED